MGTYTTAAGVNATAMGHFTSASGAYALATGQNTTANGDYSTAMGRWSHADGHIGTFVYGDSTVGTFTSNADNEFAVRASGGYRLFSNATLTTGVSLAAGSGTWASVSDRNAKEDFRDLDADETLAKVASIPIQSWRYKAEQSGARHLGPVAQDFYAAFGLGPSDKTITTIDADGVSLLAIQALARKVEAAERRNSELARTNAELAARLATLESRLEQLGPPASRR